MSNAGSDDKRLEKLKKNMEKLPEAPGVYFFRGAKKNILYIGKATSLRDRVKSYFSKDLYAARGPKLVQMMLAASRVTHIETDSVLEALVLEAQLIKKHQPEFNTRDKDNKSFSYVVITSEDYPRVIVERGRTLPEHFSEDEIKYLFGPFTSGRDLREALKIIRRIFPYRDKCTPFDELSDAQKEKARPCFNAQIGLCPGVCSGEVSKREYGKIIQNIRLFFEGKKGKVIKNIERDMKAAAKQERFEKAGELRNKIFALQHLNDTALMSRSAEIEEKYGAEASIVRIEGYDISHLAGEERVGVMVVVEEGVPKKSDYRKFKIRSKKKGDTEALEEVLRRRLRHDEWDLPDIIAMDGGEAQRNVAVKVAREMYGDKKEKPDIVSIVKDERHKPRAILGDEKVISKYKMDILLANSEAHRFAIAFQKDRRSKKFLRRK